MYDKFDALIEDIKNAESYIFLQYYIIKDDVLFQRIREALLEKAAQGVEIRILYDAMGCRSDGKHFWKEMEKQGIHVAVFFPALFGRLHLRVNYRNHRKIAVIDGKVAIKAAGGTAAGDPGHGHGAVCGKEHNTVAKPSTSLLKRRLDLYVCSHEII